MDARTDMGMTLRRKKAAEELLESTTFKDSLRLILKDIDPESGAEFVRTFMGKDPEAALALMSALPALANCFIKAALELVTLIRNYPAPMLSGMVEALLQDVDRDALARVMVEARSMGKDLAPALAGFAQDLTEQASPRKERT